MRLTPALLTGLLIAPACAGDPGTNTGEQSVGPTSAPMTGSTTDTGAPPTTSIASDTGSDASTASTASTASSTGGLKLDVGFDSSSGVDTEPPPPSCKVSDDMDAGGACEKKAPPDSFEPDVQWSFTGPDPENLIESGTTPLVANLTDDNMDGAIDLCDIPDVIVVVGPRAPSDTPPATIFVLDGATGVPHFQIATQVQYGVTPALGDIDGDGLVEIVTALPNGAAQLVAFEHDGTLKWTSTAVWQGAQSGAIALADVDADGDVEIIAGTNLFDHEGNLLWTRPGDSIYGASMAADLDGDGKLEILFGHAAVHHDGSPYYVLPDIALGGLAPYPQVANLDDDPEPEVLIAAQDALHVYEHDGTFKFKVTGPNPGGHGSKLPATIHDFDGDGISEFAASTGNTYTVYKRDGTIVWSANVIDASGLSAGTAFDFLGDGIAEAMYADEYNLFVFDGQGQPLLTSPRLSGTIIEYPTVADIDNDGSAEILVVSNTTLVGGEVSFTIQAVRDKQDRWIQARRIWNQHTYHVTNVVGIV